MSKNNFAPLFAAIVLSGCVTAMPDPAMEQRKILDDARASSISRVNDYASETKLFLEKNGTEKTITTAQEHIKKGMKDPDSAKFQNARLVDFDKGAVVCGEVNAKNSYGGYVGYRPFVASPTLAMVTKVDGKYEALDAAFNAGIFLACGR